MYVARRLDGHHDCYDHYELTSHDMLFNCDGCKMKGNGERYRCNLCQHELHIDCRNPRSTISHEFFPGSTFTFRYEPFTKQGDNNYREYSKSCDACSKDICGFSYHCQQDNLDLHPCCRNLPTALFINDTFFNLQAKGSNKCIWCKERKISVGNRDVPGWSYVSTCEKRHRFHVFCMTEMVHQACIKNGEMGLEKVDLRKLAKSGRRSGPKLNKMFETIKYVLKIILSALLGDPTLIISNVLVELVSRGL